MLIGAVPPSCLAAPMQKKKRMSQEQFSAVRRSFNKTSNLSVFVDLFATCTLVASMYKVCSLLVQVPHDASWHLRTIVVGSFLVVFICFKRS